ncbi:MAG TPA: MbcA/ParS/Xre antitoxin family protein [Oligoflexus sp.]|uniref:MbcA/ParS/Xre antitoxin family protein n=1 Tax=Oligoflexus sp. TaxID=1971216 RepID=UPI002D5CA660|nr:MbcA/ParS/Xre antitoxin family protein [Oligoflexus sp.]HYX32177.1 MbcA/ParS/Xre antitoxin family protein [Oligoflexus sp.]
MQVAGNKKELSLAQKQNVIFRLLRTLCEELLEGSKKDLAACLRVSAASVSRWFQDELCTVPHNGNDYQVILHLLAIHRSLCAIFTSPEDRRIWFKSPNSDLEGKSPEDMAKSGLAGLIHVRQYLDFERGLGV